LTFDGGTLQGVKLDERSIRAPITVGAEARWGDVLREGIACAVVSYGRNCSHATFDKSVAPY
jgi:hypothetical protein